MTQTSTTNMTDGVSERTFLIADVRGYTRFTREQGDAAAARLARVFALLACDAVEARSGRVIELRGDEALGVFDSPGAAVRAAIDLVAVCEEEAALDPTLPLNVGIGIDVGDAVPVEGGFRGMALNTAARLCSKANGGQVLLTASVVARTRDLPGIRFVSSGTAELKGFERPVELIEAVNVDVRVRPGAATEVRDEPPAAELETITPLVGREREFSWLRGTWRQARRGYGRVVFLTGPPQSGKTRLAAELAAYASAQGASVLYAGGGGAGAALAAAAIREGTAAATASAVVVLDDLDALGAPIARLLDERREAIEVAPVMVLAIACDSDADPVLAAAIERADPFGEGHRTLGPLATEEIRELARVYAGDHIEAVPLESVERASGGLPGPVHELMSEWAEQEAGRRLAAAAEWLASEQTNRKDTLEFANNVIKLKLARLYAGLERPAEATGSLCPYKGLASFEEADAHLFFGRERLVGELAARTVGQGLLAVVGASGSGKSSLILAGLVPSLAAGVLPGSEGWAVTWMRPGEHPVAELGRFDHGDAQVGRRILVIDQFEEIFTTADGNERSVFVEQLLRLARDPEAVLVVLTLRGDFLDQCAAYPELAQFISANQVLVGPMSDEELRRAIELPARRVGLRVDRALVEALVEEAVDEPGALPLLSTALVELWQLRGGGWLRMASYETAGGIRGAVARLAEATFARFDERERVAARSILLRLVGAGEGESVVRRRASVTEFDLDRDPLAAAVLSRLTQDRLVTRTEDKVEVAHEALLREWPRLQTWLNEDVEGRQLRRHLAQAARQWDERDREDADLYRGTRLSGAVDWAATHGQELNQLERDFLAASSRASQRSVRRLRAGAAVLAVLLLAAVAAGVVALVQRGQARHAARVALADSLGAQAIADPHLDRAVLLGTEGVELDPSVRTEGDLLTALLRAPSAIRTLHGDGLRVNGMALSPDGRTLALEDNVPNILFLDAATGRRRGEVTSKRLRAGPSVLTYTPQGSLVAFANAAGANGPREVDLFDPKTVAVRSRLLLPLSVRKAIQPGRTFFASPNFGGNDFSLARGGRLIATAVAGHAVQWTLPSGRLAARPFAVPASAATVFYTARGRRLLAVAETKTWLLDARTGRVLRAYSSGGPVAALSPDARTMVFGEADGSVRFLDLDSGTVTTSTAAHAGAVQAVGFTPDGKTAITSGEDSKTRIWHVATYSATRTLAGHAGGGIPAQAISPDGSTLYTGGVDGNAIAWDLSGKRGLGPTFPAAGTDPRVDAWNVAITPHGRLLAVGATDGTVNVWDTRSVRKLRSFRTGDGAVAALSFSPNGRSLLVATDTQSGSRHGSLAIWALQPVPHLLRRLHGLRGVVTWAAFSPDGTLVGATGASTQPKDPFARDGLIAEWKTATGRILAKPTLLHGGGEAVDVSFGSHGTIVAVAQLGDRAAVVDPARREIIARWKDSSAELTVGAALAPAGKLVATSDLDGFLRVWHSATGRPELPPIRASEADVNSVNWSPDGSRLVTAGGDGTLRLYDARSGQQIGASMPIGAPLSPYATFSQDGSTLAVSDATGRAWLYPATAAGWETYACRFANRDLSRDEWSRFIPAQPYRQICSGKGKR